MEDHGQKAGYNLKDVILGGQDGLVNVLGVILAVAIATSDAKIVIIAGLAATFAESISMAAVAYTSSKAMKDFYRSQMSKEIKEIEETPDVERKEIRDIYFAKGFRGHLLAAIVRKITGDKKLWLKTMIEEEMHLDPEEYKNPGRDAAIVGFSSLIGSFIPLLPFFAFSVSQAVYASVLLSALVLFLTGAIKGRITTGSWIRSGIEITLIGMAAALIGYAIGALLGVSIYAA